MTLHVHFLQPLSPDAQQALETQLASSIQITTGDEIAAPERVNILVGGYPSDAQLDGSPNLRAVIVPWAGVPAETQEKLRARPHLSLHNLHHNYIPTAEVGLALLLAAAKAVVTLDQDLRRDDWTNRYVLTASTLLDGRTAVILGYGAIGKRMARGCIGMGMKPIGIRRSVETMQMEDGVPVYPISALHTLLPKADALLMALPGTPETDGMIGAAELALLPADAVVVNVGRGHTIDEEALYHALRDRKIRAAGIDVWWHYPEDGTDRTATPPSRFPFRDLDNIVMSPHRGGWINDEANERVAALAVLLNAAAQSSAMPNKVDIDLGY